MNAPFSFRSQWRYIELCSRDRRSRLAGVFNLSLVMARLDRAIEEQKTHIFQLCLDGQVKPGHDMM
jgi:hypothetical protein